MNKLYQSKVFIKKYLFIGILLISLLTRLYYLNTGMISISHDEADIFLMGRIVAQTGKDIYHNSFFLTTGYLTAKPGIPIYISAIGSLLLPNGNPFYSRLPFVLLNSLTPFFIFLIILQITKNSLFSFINFMVFNFSPWFGSLTATGYEAFIFLLFFLIAFYSLISIKHRIYSLLVSALFLFLAFNSYMGTKIIFPILTICLLLYAYYLKKQLTRKTICLLVGITICINVFLFGTTYFLPNNSLMLNEASSNILFFNKAKTSGLLWYANLISQGPLWMKRIIINKISIPLWDSLVKYSESFNLQTLFFTGENSPYGFGGLLGIFYFVDLFIFFLGLITLNKISFKKLSPVFLLFAIGGIPTAIVTNSPSIVLRGILLAIPYSIVISWGLFYLITNKKKIFLVYIFFLILNIVYFQMVYYVRVKVIMSDQYHYNEYVLIRSVDKMLKKGVKIGGINVEETNATMLLALYYSKTLNQSQIKNLELHKYFIRQIPLDSGCPTNITANSAYIIRKITCKDFLETHPLFNQKIIVSSAKHTGNDYILISPKNTTNISEIKD